MSYVIKNVGPKLIPFFKTIAIYFVVFIPQSNPGLFAALLKCLPIISLMLFVVWFGRNIDKENQHFPKKILCGLFFSCIGDFCLIWPELFIIGMLSFAVGHINYIMAFGFKPFNLPLAAGTCMITLLGCLYLMPGLSDVLVPGVPLYSILLSTMMWRALARIEFKQNTWTWSQVFAGIGAILFVLSDLLIGINMFKFEVPYAQAFIMSTYYAGQLGITLSIVDFCGAKKIRSN